MYSIDMGQVFSLKKLSVQRSGYTCASSTDLACEGRHTPEEGITGTRTAGAVPQTAGRFFIRIEAEPGPVP